MRARDFKDLAADLRELGVRSGQHLLVHCSMTSLGPVADGPEPFVTKGRTGDAESCRSTRPPLPEEAGGKGFTVVVQGRHLLDEYARLAAERMGYAVRSAEFDDFPDRAGRGPGVLLIDRDALTAEDLAAEIDARAAGLPVKENPHD